MGVSWLDSISKVDSERYGFLVEVLSKLFQNSVPVLNGFILGTKDIPGISKALIDVSKLSISEPIDALNRIHELASSLNGVKIPSSMQEEAIHAYTDISLSPSLRSSASGNEMIIGQKRQD